MAFIEENSVMVILAKLLDIRERDLRYYLEDLNYHKEAVNFLRKHKIFAIYKSTDKTPIRFCGIAYEGPKFLYAYNGFKKITVDQHFYVKYGIRLKFKNLPCIIGKRGTGVSYYPMELMYIKNQNGIPLRTKKLDRIPKPIEYPTACTIVDKPSKSIDGSVDYEEICKSLQDISL